MWIYLILTIYLIHYHPMFSNWDNMNERSIRTVEKMAETMIEDPTGYKDSWEIDYLKY